MSDGNCKTYINPYLAGFLIGLTLITSYLILGVGLGASNGLARLAAWCGLSVAPGHFLASEYFGAWGERPLNYYLVFMLAGIFVGGFLSALTNGRISIQIERGVAFSPWKRLILVFLGGILAGFASRLSRGCTTGNGLSGVSLLNTGAVAFLLAVVIGGYLAAWFFRRQWHD